MGGKALLNQIQTRRYNKDEYFSLCISLLEQFKLDATTGKRRIAIVPAYRNKESFGDCDICYEVFAGESSAQIKDMIYGLFSPSAYSLNDKVHSFDYKDLQIDLICLESEIFDAALFYFSWNDLGNLIGRQFKSLFDLSYGHEGVLFPVRIDNTRVLDKLVVTRDTQEAFELIGLDYERWEAGFDTLEEVFQYVIDYPYFNKEAFDLENLNHINRVRNRKRQTYMQFLQYLGDKGVKSKTEGLAERQAYVREVLKKKGLFERRDELFLGAERQRAARYKMLNVFDAEFPELKDKELGVVIVKLRESIKILGIDFVEYMENHSSQEIKELIENAQAKN